MYRFNPANSFAFDNDQVLDKEIQPVRITKTLPLIACRKIQLPFESNASQITLDRQCTLVRRFKQAWTQGAVHLYSGTNNLLRAGIFQMSHHNSLLFLCVLCLIFSFASLR